MRNKRESETTIINRKTLKKQLVQQKNENKTEKNYCRLTVLIGAERKLRHDKSHSNLCVSFHFLILEQPINVPCICRINARVHFWVGCKCLWLSHSRKHCHWFQMIFITIVARHMIKLRQHCSHSTHFSFFSLIRGVYCRKFVLLVNTSSLCSCNINFQLSKCR